MDLSRNSTRTEETYSVQGCSERRGPGVQSGSSFTPEITFLTVKSCDHCKSLNLSLGFAKRLMDYSKALNTIDEQIVRLRNVLQDSQLNHLYDQMRKSEGIWAKICELESLEHRSDDRSLSPELCTLQVHQSTPKKGSSAKGFFEEGPTLSETGPVHEDLQLNTRNGEFGNATPTESLDFTAEEIPPAAAPGNSLDGDSLPLSHGPEHLQVLDSGIHEGESVQEEEEESEKDWAVANASLPSSSQSKSSLGYEEMEEVDSTEMETFTAQERHTHWLRFLKFVHLLVFGAVVCFLILGPFHWCWDRVPRSWISDSFIGGVLNLCHDPLCNPPI
ncbi:uncharacterized protein LOC108942331 isoform X1 [Arapaima gigas]